MADPRPITRCAKEHCLAQVRRAGLHCHNHGGQLPMTFARGIRCDAFTANGARCHVRVARDGQLCVRHALIDAEVEGS